jgi:hypothetical protein
MNPQSLADLLTLPSPPGAVGESPAIDKAGG